MLIYRCSRQSHAAVLSATSSFQTTTTPFRCLSSNGNNNGNNNNSNNNSNDNNFSRIRRPNQTGFNKPGGPSVSRNRPSSPPSPLAAPQPSLLRTHMIDLFPGNYDDDDDDDDLASTDASSDTTMMEGWDDDDSNYSDMEATMAQLHRQSLEREAQKQRWLQNSIPPVRVPVIDEMGRSYGRGGRKAAQARVWLTPGFGNVTVNRKDIIDYFPRFSDRELVTSPLVVTRTCGKFDLQCIVKGGGLTGQAGAIRLGVARALQYWNPQAYRPALKKMGYLTRDARKVERKKIGRVKARKRPQWNRR